MCGTRRPSSLGLAAGHKNPFSFSATFFYDRPSKEQCSRAIYSGSGFEEFARWRVTRGQIIGILFFAVFVITAPLLLHAADVVSFPSGDLTLHGDA